MAVPKKKTSKSRRDMRRSQHDKITAANIVSCSSCGAPRRPHFVCPSCGFYKNRTVIQFVAPSTDTESTED